LHAEWVLVLHVNGCKKRKKKITWCRGWLVGSAKKFDVRLVAVTTMKTWQRKWEKAAMREKRWKHEE
jgi:hypothetical protein